MCVPGLIIGKSQLTYENLPSQRIHETFGFRRDCFGHLDPNIDG